MEEIWRLFSWDDIFLHIYLEKLAKDGNRAARLESMLSRLL